jgi:hypothetical protein
VGEASVKNKREEKRIGNPEVNKSKCRCMDNVKMDLKETGWEHFDWIHLAQE